MRNNILRTIFLGKTAFSSISIHPKRYWQHLWDMMGSLPSPSQYGMADLSPDQDPGQHPPWPDVCLRGRRRRCPSAWPQPCFLYTTNSSFVFISKQKTLVDVTLENSNIKDQIRNLQKTYEASMEKLQEKQRQLDVAQVENQLLKMKVKTRLDFLLTFLFFLLSLSSMSFSLFSIWFSHPLWSAP